MIAKPIRPAGDEDPAPASQRQAYAR
jgi:hypothetical protein